MNWEKFLVLASEECISSESENMDNQRSRTIGSDGGDLFVRDALSY